MPRDQLATQHKAALKKCTRRSTLKITLGNGEILRYATGFIPSIGGFSYAARLASPDNDLNLELTGAEEGVNLKISNVKLLTGHFLINTPDVLTNTRAVFGCWFKDRTNGNNWHDEKLPGKIEVGAIDGQWINIYFKNLAAATVYKGRTIDSVMPNTQIQKPTTTVYNDISSDPGSGVGSGGFVSDGRGSRYELPAASVWDWEMQRLDEALLS